jgi:hypothetical protein
VPKSAVKLGARGQRHAAGKRSCRPAQLRTGGGSRCYAGQKPRVAPEGGWGGAVSCPRRAPQGAKHEEGYAWRSEGRLGRDAGNVP